MKWLDLSWPEVALIIVIIVFGTAAVRPEVLDVVAQFFGQVGHLFSYLKLW